MSETNLRAALDNHLHTMASLPDVDWLGQGLDQAGQIYYSVNVLPAEDITVGMESGGSNVLAGIYQITVNVPKNSGKAVYMTEIEKIRTRFARSQVMTYDGTTVALHKVFSSAEITDENYLRFPISIIYRAAI